MKILRKNIQSGFTLMEILIAVAVLAIGVVAVVNLFPVGLQAARRTANFSDAAALAQRQMELYRAYGYGEIDDMFGSIPAGDTDYYPDQTDTEVFPDDEDYSWWMMLEKHNTLNMFEMTLNIYWLDGGQEQYETFVTYIADYGE